MPYRDITTQKEYTARKNREYRKARPEYFNMKAKEFYQRNKEIINNKRRKNPYSLLSTLKRNAHIRGLPFTLTKETFKIWWENQEQKCIYCEVPVERLIIVDKSKKLVRRLSIDRIDNSRGYEIGNLALCCMQCNFIKSNLFTFEEMKEIGIKYIKPKWQS